MSVSKYMSEGVGGRVSCRGMHVEVVGGRGSNKKVDMVTFHTHIDTIHYTHRLITPLSGCAFRYKVTYPAASLRERGE